MNLLDFLFPKFCVGCGKWGIYFCPKCINNITQTNLVCPNCERPSIGGKTHPLCQKKYGLDGLWNLGVYQDPLRKAIGKLKYKLVLEIAVSLADLMVLYWAKHTPQFFEEIKKGGVENWAIIPVPLHTKRQNFRGFNQTESIGKLLSKKLGLGYLEALKRTRHTKQQVGLRGKARYQNIRGAFAIDPSIVSLSRDDKLRSKNYTQLVNCLLIDDVWTTGSTLKECCYELKRNGAKKVWAITLAR